MTYLLLAGIPLLLFILYILIIGWLDGREMDRIMDRAEKQARKEFPWLWFKGGK